MNSHQRRVARRKAERRQRQFAKAFDVLKQVYAAHGEGFSKLLEPSPIELLAGRGEPIEFVVPYRLRREMFGASLPEPKEPP